MFVLLKGATKEQAFKIGNEIAEAVTATNPKPIKLKFEKVRDVLYEQFVWECTLFLFECESFLRSCVFGQVYLPCVLQTKKRYVGYMYESWDQKNPVFDAKGIETVRRDGCPAVAKVTIFDNVTGSTCQSHCSCNRKQSVKLNILRKLRKKKLLLLSIIIIIKNVNLTIDI